MIRLGLVIAITLQFFQSAHAQWNTQLFTRNGPDADTHYGGVIFPLGDQNSDGFDDWAVMGGGAASPYAQHARLDLFHGGATLSTNPYHTYTADSVWPRRLVDAGSAGDLNGDGIVDWYAHVGNYGTPYDHDGAIYFGGPVASDTPSLLISVPYLGGIKAMGDFNGDGFDDLYVYYGVFSGGEDWGRAYFGGNPMDTIPDWVIHSPADLPQRAYLRSFGDLNGDGYADAWSYSYSPAMGYIFYGSAHPDTVPAITWMNYNAYPSAIVRDINGDGRDDLLVQGDINVEVHLGRANMSRTPDTYIHCPPYTVRFVSAGDLNGDGFNDFIAQARDGEEPTTHAIFLGYHWINPNPVFQITTLLWNSAGVGDVNNNGTDDWAIGGYSGGGPGTAIVYSGNHNAHVAAKERPAFAPSDFNLSAYPNPFNPTTTISFSLPASGAATISAFDVLGRRVAVLSDGLQDRGAHQLRFDAAGLPSGTYVIHLETAGNSVSRTLQLIR